jgi:hypothetical protein
MNKSDDQGWSRGRPRAPGIYERSLRDVTASDEAHFSRWDGEAWLRLARTPELAARQTERSLFNTEPFVWRAAA